MTRHYFLDSLNNVARFIPSLTGCSNLRLLLGWTVGGCIVIFFLLQVWRPCYFLTDDNLSGGFPVYTEMGRDIKTGEAPFISKYLFGGNYNFLRDVDSMQWHPFILIPALLADTPGRFWIVDAAAFLLFLLTTVGFTLLAYALQKEFSLGIPDAYLIFYILSFVFSTFILTIGASWLNFLGNQSALPWLALGILDRKIVRGTFLIFIFTVHEILIAYPPLTVSCGLFLTLFVLGVGIWRRSPMPVLCYCTGNLLALLLLTPLLLQVLDGFAHSDRILPLPLSELRRYSIPASQFPFSFTMGNWAEPVAIFWGDKFLTTLAFPFVSSILACGAAWCVIPALFIPAPWRPLEKICLVIAGLLILWIIRPAWMATAMFHLPFFRSMRWSFREGLIFLFFVHLLLILRFPSPIPRWQPILVLFSLTMFLLPLPFIRVPTLNPFFLDRQLLFSGQADRFWAAVKTQLKPDDEIATVINWPDFQVNSKNIPLTLLGTGNFPAYFRVKCISGYSPTAPADQVPLKTYPGLWFGAFRDDQVKQILAERPDLRLLRVEGSNPLKITISSGSGPEIDLSPCLRAAGISLGADPEPAAH